MIKNRSIFSYLQLLKFAPIFMVFPMDFLYRLLCPKWKLQWLWFHYLLFLLWYWGDFLLILIIYQTFLNGLNIYPCLNMGIRLLLLMNLILLILNVLILLQNYNVIQNLNLDLKKIWLKISII